MTREKESSSIDSEPQGYAKGRRHMCRAEALVDSGIASVVIQEDGMRRRELPSEKATGEGNEFGVAQGIKKSGARLVPVKVHDAELVRRAVAKDREAYRELVERYQARAVSIAFGILKNREDAEDVVQESFVKAYMSLPNFKGNSSFYTWLYRIVYNMSIDVKRKAARSAVYESDIDEKELEHRLEGAGQIQSGPDMDLMRKEKLRCINTAMQGISEEHRTVIMLREVDGLDYQQIAEITGVSKGTIMSRLHYARKKLQSALEGFFARENSVDIDKLGSGKGNGRVSPKGDGSIKEEDSKIKNVVVRNE